MKYFQLLIESHSNFLFKILLIYKSREMTLFFFSGAGCVQTVAIIGPIFGFLLGSLCARLYVDIGFVNLGKEVCFIYLFIYLSHCSFFF